MTVADLKSKGAMQLSDAQLKALIVGKAFWVRDNVTTEQFSANFTNEGHYTVFHVGKYSNVPSGFGPVARDGYQGTTNPYKIEGGKLITFVSQEPYSYTLYKVGDTYYGARSNEFGFANYEIIAVPSPPIVSNPLTAMLNQFSVELGLTQEQRRQVFPIIKGELPKLQELKKNTCLKPLDKLKQLKEISDDLDAKITPLLDQQQQQKFQQVREEHRRELLKKMAGQVMQMIQTDIKQEF